MADVKLFMRSCKMIAPALEQQQMTIEPQRFPSTASGIIHTTVVGQSRQRGRGREDVSGGWFVVQLAMRIHLFMG